MVATTQQSWQGSSGDGDHHATAAANALMGLED